VGVMRILDTSGDTAVAWDTQDATPSVRQAEELFERLANQRKIPFARAADAPVEGNVADQGLRPKR
jgi:hypothetical protein